MTLKLGPSRHHGASTRQDDAQRIRHCTTPDGIDAMAVYDGKPSHTHSASNLPTPPLTALVRSEAPTGAFFFAEPDDRTKPINVLLRLKRPDSVKTNMTMNGQFLGTCNTYGQYTLDQMWHKPIIKLKFGQNQSIPSELSSACERP